jgi:hypothetical protein
MPTKPCDNSSDLLRAVADRIAAHTPDNPTWDQSVWLRSGANTLEDVGDFAGIDVDGCGTYGCIAGWALALSTPDLLTRRWHDAYGFETEDESGVYSYGPIGRTAETLLGLSNELRRRVFDLNFGDRWTFEPSYDQGPSRVAQFLRDLAALPEQRGLEEAYTIGLRP